VNDDREEIRALVHAYAERIDEGDLDGVADLFADATIIAGNGMEFSGRETLAELWRNSVVLHEDGRTDVCHLISNLTIALDDDSTARASSYVTVMQARPGFELRPIAVSRHRDRFAKVDGRWRFIERRDRQVLAGDLSHHVVGAAAPAHEGDS
jgi:uncharacterized protein (TIGR02246 family)